MWGVFFGISKAFNKVWHKGLLFKLKSYVIKGDLFLIECYLSNRELRIVLNGQTSDLKKINSVVPLGPILGPFLLIYINDLPDWITSICKTFAADNSLFSKVNGTRNSQNALNSDIESISNWA